jgi:hypothetical protein
MCDELRHEYRRHFPFDRRRHPRPPEPRRARGHQPRARAR